MTDQVPSNPGNSKDFKKEQTSSDEFSAEEKRINKNQDKGSSRPHESVVIESPEINTENDPRVN